MNRMPQFATFAAFLLFFAMLTPSYGLCLKQDMEGGWVNRSESGMIKSVNIAFRCCDSVQNGQTACNPSEDTVRVRGICGGSGTCDWGRVTSQNLFLDESLAQYTRVDANFETASEKKAMVILRLSADELFIYWSNRFPNNEGQDFSVIEHLVRRHCLNYMGHEICLPPKGKTIAFPR